MYTKQFLIISGLLENKQGAKNMVVEDNKGEENLAEEDDNQRTENLARFPVRRFASTGRGGGGTPGWGAEHTALRPSRGKENVSRRRRNRGLVARRGPRGGRRRNGGGKGWPPWTPP